MLVMCVGVFGVFRGDLPADTYESTPDVRRFKIRGPGGPILSQAHKTYVYKQLAAAQGLLPLSIPVFSRMYANAVQVPSTAHIRRR